MMLTGTFRLQAKSFHDKHFHCTAVSLIIFLFFYIYTIALSCWTYSATFIQKNSPIKQKIALPCSRNLRQILAHSLLLMIKLEVWNDSTNKMMEFRRLTCGGGRPPAPSGQSGNMIVRFGVLHWQEGEGLDMLQLPLRKMSVTDWSTGGVNQSEPLEEHGNSLQKKQWGKQDYFLVNQLHVWPHRW